MSAYLYGIHHKLELPAFYHKQSISLFFTASKDNLPTWVIVAQKIPHSSIAEKILKTDIVYAAPLRFNGFFWGLGGSSGERIHDPLVISAMFFCGSVNIPEDDRIKVLETLYDARHETEERLWTGKDLVTEHISSKIELWPAYRMAYSQMELTVSNMQGKDRWAGPQEALYTFHLPEGGVVSSLSLWINGREEKGILTTKSKADSAYKTIVGKERRDPSVVHWKEGNTVTVRVFPVQRGESRKFKLGITSTLDFFNDKLEYHNIIFQGPSVYDAKEDIKITTNDGSPFLNVPAGFDAGKDFLTRNAGRYKKAWSLRVASKPLDSRKFRFNGHEYQVTQLVKESENFSPSAIYLDINTAWSVSDFNRVLKIVKDKMVFVTNGDSLVRLTPMNADSEFRRLRENNFSLFPFYKIADINSSLVITKTGLLSPTIADLRQSDYLKSLQAFFTNRRSVHIFNISGDLSPFVKSMKEFRMLKYQKGDFGQLTKLLRNGKFISAHENSNLISYDNAGISLQRTIAGLQNDTDQIAAPDHLMRLFTYSHIMQQSGAGILSDTLQEASMISEAEQAHVVTPFSSLVVLETQADYDRFNIRSSKDSLGNASASSNGAVPEPHEWALIILVTAVCVWLKFKNAGRFA